MCCDHTILGYRDFRPCLELGQHGQNLSRDADGRHVPGCRVGLRGRDGQRHGGLMVDSRREGLSETVVGNPIDLRFTIFRLRRPLREICDPFDCAQDRFSIYFSVAPSGRAQAAVLAVGDQKNPCLSAFVGSLTIQLSFEIQDSGKHENARDFHLMRPKGYSTILSRKLWIFSLK